MKDKYALSIGISDYRHLNKLDNARNDATLIGQVCRELEFKTDVKFDLDRASLYLELKACRERVADVSVALLYFAGHGIQRNGANYLVPTDAIIIDENDIEQYSISLDYVLGCFSQGKNHVTIIILDACRNNPFERIRGFQNSGLAYVEAGANSIICFSTSPGRVASDGTGDNSPYSQCLASTLRNRNMTFIQQLCENRNGVLGLTSGAQLPWESIALLSDFYLYDPLAISSNDLYRNIVFGMRNAINNHIPKMLEQKVSLDESTEGGEATIHRYKGVVYHINKHIYGETFQYNIEYFIFNGRPISCLIFVMKYKVPMYVDSFNISESTILKREVIFRGTEIYYDSGSENIGIDLSYLVMEFKKYCHDLSAPGDPKY